MTGKMLSLEERQAKLDTTIQEFANEISIICALEAGGKIDPQEAYRRIKTRWKQVKASKRELFPKLNQGQESDSGDEVDVNDGEAI